MPKSELDVELEKVAEAQKEFDDAINDIMDKTDEEIKEAEEARAKESDGTGESTGDQTTEAGTVPGTTEDPQKKANLEPDPSQMAGTGVDVSAMQAEVEQLKSELQKEKQRTASWDGRIRAANDKVKSLEAENAKLTEQLSTKVATEDNEQEQSDQEVMDKFKSTFPELVDVVNILEKKIKVTSTTAKSEVKPEVTPDTTEQVPAADATNTTESTASNTEHYDATRKAHPDLDEAVNTGVLLTWINTQPDYIRPYLESVYYGKNGNGSSQQVIDMVTEFKSKSGWKSQIKSGDKAKDDKLKSMLESEGGSAGAKTDGPDKNDFAGAAKEAFK
jgi:hypothetical protein